jgi:hypothetical protein
LRATNMDQFSRPIATGRIEFSARPETKRHATIKISVSRHLSESGSLDRRCAPFLPMPQTKGISPMEESNDCTHLARRYTTG